MDAVGKKIPPPTTHGSLMKTLDQRAMKSNDHLWRKVEKNLNHRRLPLARVLELSRDAHQKNQK